ncbi:C40 family peptidase [Olivibacter sp. SDN3]|uniref:C40 family peptidase n=1 Tax=Olivibacter sp. SDN3 TaxID=2764720 RepID=UPI0021051640|nr:NlpC/P60 family protein [Olivibacter sp. SDN3]
MEKNSGQIITDASNVNNYHRTGNVLNDYAMFMGVKTSDLKNERLYLLINEWMGTPHLYGGSSKRGIDCSAFAVMVMSQAYGKSIPRSSSEQASAVKRKYERQLQEGDLLFFRFGSSKINHVGIYLHNNKFAHVSTSKGVIVSDLKDAWYYKGFKRCGTVR